MKDRRTVTPSKFEKADRLKLLPPYLFVELNRAKRKAMDEGRPIIDLGIGDPDLPTPPFIVKELAAAASETLNQKYPPDEGLPELKESFAGWFKQRFGVTLDPDGEILPLIGSKEGIAHLSLAVLNPYDMVLVPEPGYPVYGNSAIFAGAVPHFMPLLKSNAFLPDFDLVPEHVRKKAKLMWLCYPNNPTAAIADSGFFERAAEFARAHDIIIAHDAAYSELYYDTPPPSILAVDGASDIAVEFHSMSKTFNMTGWRIAFAAGNANIVGALAQFKSNCDSGVFVAIQYAAVKAYSSPEGVIATAANREAFRKRRDLFVKALRNGGLTPDTPEATYYVWIPTPRAIPGVEMAQRLLDEVDVIVTPGSGFGPSGSGYIRAAITRDAAVLAEAARRITSLDW